MLNLYLQLKKNCKIYSIQQFNTVKKKNGKMKQERAAAKNEV